MPVCPSVDSGLCNGNNIHNADLCEKYGLCGSNDIRNTARATVAIMQEVMDICEDLKSIGRFVWQ